MDHLARLHGTMLSDKNGYYAPLAIASCNVKLENSHDIFHKSCDFSKSFSSFSYPPMPRKNAFEYYSFEFVGSPSSLLR